MKWDRPTLLCKLLYQGLIYNPGDRCLISKEQILDHIGFRVHKFNNRSKPDNKSRIAIFSCFSEFGSEIVGSLYCIPFMLQSHYLGYYSIVLGWYGRSFLYKHIVDEFWEIDPQCQWLRDYCRAFHHESTNLRIVEKKCRQFGHLIHAHEMGMYTLREIFPDVQKVAYRAAWPKIENFDKLSEIREFLPNNKVVGVTARNRKTYGRNLSYEFYIKLVDMLQSKGYTVVWMGEKETTHQCPDGVLNFRDSKHSADLEKTLLLISKMKFTIQFFTASSRLAGLVGTPFIIFESPDQLGGLNDNFGGNGQEGTRLRLCTKGKMKVIAVNYESIETDNFMGLDLVKRSVDEIETNNYEVIRPVIH